MAIITSPGRLLLDPLAEAFDNGPRPLTVVVLSPAEARVTSPGTGGIAVLTGSGLAAQTVGGLPSVAGLVSAVEIRMPRPVWDATATPPGDVLVETTTMTIRGIAWQAETLVAGLRNMVGQDDRTGVDALLGLQPLTLDYSETEGGVVHDFSGVASAITVLPYDGSNSVTLGRGNDTVLAGGGFESLGGGGGTDTLDYSGAGFTGGVRLDRFGTARGQWQQADFRQWTDFEIIRGTRDHGDFLQAGPQADVLEGLGGNDTLMGDGIPASAAATRRSRSGGCIR